MLYSDFQYSKSPGIVNKVSRFSPFSGGEGMERGMNEEFCGDCQRCARSIHPVGAGPSPGMKNGVPGGTPFKGTKI